MPPGDDLAGRPLADLWSLAGRRAVVTGGGSGLGRAISHRLAEAGAKVVVADIAQEAAERTVAEVNGEWAILDVTDTAAIAATAERVAAKGGLDIWVNNAGVYPSKPVLDMTDEDWDRVVRINLTGTFAGCREAARHMPSGGVIVNMASIAGLRGRGPAIPHYAATKHGVVGLTKQLALEFAPRGIRVVAVAPTTIVTEGVRRGLGDPPDLEARIAAPLGRAGQPDDVARVVSFLASDMAAFMTGTTVTVDGGELAR